MSLELGTVVAYDDNTVGWLVEDDDGGLVVQAPDGQRYAYTYRWEALATPYELARMYTAGVLYRPHSVFDSLLGRIAAALGFVALNVGIGVALVMEAWRRW